MTSAECYTCMGVHDPDVACVGPMRSAVPDDALFDEPGPELGPIFAAAYGGECTSCDGSIVPGDDTIRADSRGGWIHADDDCERMAR